MFNIVKYQLPEKLLGLLLPLILGSGAANAQGDFNPVSPPEPQARYKLTVNVSPAGVGYASGSGKYSQGTRVSLNTSTADSDYTFKHWERNGQVLSTYRYFTYTTTDSDETVTAVYEFVEFNPASPAEPEMAYKQYKLNLACDPPEACSFNINSGARYRAGATFAVRAYPSQGFTFDGWFNGEQRVSESLNMNFTMPDEHTTLTARFTFTPTNPDEPQGGSQENVDNTPGKVGDVNDDNVVDMEDADIVKNHYLSEKPYIKKYDVNEDGVINVTDVTLILSIYLSQQ